MVALSFQLRRSAPLLDAYLNYYEVPSRLPFTIPGHKQKAANLDEGLGKVVDSDVPLYGGLDEIKLKNQTLRHAEALAAKLWQADYSRFSTGGSTHANQAIVLALGKPGDKVAVSRTAHRSILGALVLAGLNPIWLSPDIDTKTGIPLGISVNEFTKSLRENPVALLLTEPGYLGTLSDLEALIQTAHKHSIPVIVDSAWGGHFGFHRGKGNGDNPITTIPKHAIQLGADALITSTHKSLPGYSASALLLANKKLLNLDRIEQSFETTHTTSPPGASLASIDGCRALLQTMGDDLLTELLHNINTFKCIVQAHFDAPIFLNTADFPANRFDPCKIVLRANQIGCSGVQIESELICNYIRVEMADQDTVVFHVTIIDKKSDFEQLAKILIKILKELQSNPRPSATALSWSVVPTQALSMRDAFFADTEMASASRAIGRISADLIAPYPPGVAVVAPGEVLTEAIVKGLTRAKQAGVRIAYATDSSLNTYRVVK